ncbi:MAG: glycosyltransferase 61 family protein [Cyanobacteriota bacterium]|nr:glycosyltransferase 61 family protein [Cyanobacteriota bacterium]
MGTARANQGSASLLRTVEDVLALPRAEFVQEGRESDGLIWDPGGEAILGEALPAIFTARPLEEVRVDGEAVRAEARRAWEAAERIEAPVIYGGYLLRHFGHFLHESLSRLWWLAPSAGMASPAREVAERLRELEAEVVFFMPKWPAPGNTLAPYMEEILALLRLPAGRIRILDRPLRFRQLLIPASLWGFALPARELDQHLGCDSRALMRHLLASAAMPPAPEGALAAGQGEKLYVTRSGLPSQLGRLMGDVVLDPLLQAMGYTVFHPERAPLAEQIHRYARARDLVFMDGSSLYVLWFAKLRRGTRVRVILRRRQGRWLCEKVRELLPAGPRIRWQVLDGLRGEGLTSEKDWESQNVADLRTLLRQLGGAAPATLPEAAAAALARHTDTFVEQGTPEQLSRVLAALIAAVATDPSRAHTLRGRIYHWLRRRLAARRLTSR